MYKMKFAVKKLLPGKTAWKTWNSFFLKNLELQDKQQELYDKIAEVRNNQRKINQLKEEELVKLEEIAKLNTEEAKNYY